MASKSRRTRPTHIWVSPRIKVLLGEVLSLMLHLLFVLLFILPFTFTIRWIKIIRGIWLLRVRRAKVLDSEPNWEDLRLLLCLERAAMKALYSSSSAFSWSSSESSSSSSFQSKGWTSSRVKTWGGRGNIRKGRGGSIGLGGGGGMLMLGELESSPEELELCLGELEATKEKLDICFDRSFLWENIRRYRRNEK